MTRPRTRTPAQRWAVLAGVAAMAIGAPVPVSAAAAEGSTTRTPPCGQGSWVAGTVDLCAGELVYRDYVYDDHGAASTSDIPQEGEGLYAAIRPYHDGWGNTSPAGAADYLGLTPESRDNTADLVALRMRVTRTQLTVTAELNTLTNPSTAQVLLGIDTDNNALTRSGLTWLDGVLASPFSRQPLTNTGLDRFVQLTHGNPDSNLLTATVPRPPGATWRLQAVVTRTLPISAAPVVMNVAFRGLDERGGWWDNAQAAALARGDITAFAHTVSVADLDRNVTRRAVVPAGKLRQRVYFSEHNPGPGEGISHTGVAGPGTWAKDSLLHPSQGFTHIGKYQPYGFYLPTDPGPHELQLLLHGMGENHSTQMWDPASGTNPPPIAAAFGRDSNRIFASPLGRGPRGFYSSYSERDVLDVLADVKAIYRVDDDKVFLSGTSMGGYGAMRIGALHPDEFAAVVQWVGYTGDAANTSADSTIDRPVDIAFAAVGNAVELLGNLRHVPMAAWYAGADELVPATQAIAVRDRLAELNLPSAWWLHPTANHSSPATINDWAKESGWSAGRTKVEDPAHVTYRTDKRFFAPEAGVVPDGAYWISGIMPAGPGYADVDAISHGCGAEEARTTLTTDTGDKPVLWTGQFINASGTTKSPTAARLDLTLANITALTVDTGNPNAPTGTKGACLGRAAFEYHVTTDRPVTVTFTDGRSLKFDSAGTHHGALAAG
ncbi:MAG: hypothetical protein ACRDQ7_26500 [Haloechinothrix sp.]